MYPFNYDVSLRIRHPSMDPDYICRTLGLKAEIKWKAGTERKTPTGERLVGVYDTSYCCFRIKHSKNEELSDCIRNYNHELFKQKAFFKSIRLTGGSLEYFIGWFADKDSGETFDLELLNELVELGIEIAICVYPKRWAKK